MRHKGTITTWNDDRGFGFVTPDAGGERVFLHIRGFMGGQPRPRGAEAVTFEIDADGSKGPRAINVRYTAVPSYASSYPAATTGGGLGAVGFLMALVILAILGRAPWWMVVLYFGASAAAFPVYSSDKRQAQSGGWRTPESTMHLLSVGGGWPGALVAQQLYRHKTRKIPFQIVFWMIGAGHLVFWVWLLNQ
jgi:uncharacterized membrane protein YsdA (DUF1294 family)/cold shock CspA family protein